MRRRMMKKRMRRLRMMIDDGDDYDVEDGNDDA